MKQFASSAMMRAIAHGARLQGTATAHWPRSPNAQFPIDGKREVIGSLLAERGAIGLMRATDGVATVPSEPLLEAFLAAKSVLDLLDRWHRLERFAHSTHRVNVLKATEHKVLLEHVSMRADSSPLWAEDAVVFGVITNLCERAGAQNVQAGPPASVVDLTPQPWRCAGTWQKAETEGSLRYWAITHTNMHPAPAKQDADEDKKALMPRIRTLLTQDPIRRWKTADVASAVAMSPRSLQRHLKEQGTSLTELLLQTRLEQATKLLAKPDADIAEIGFLSGFSDQAHFTRLFKRFTGLTPKRFACDFL